MISKIKSVIIHIFGIAYDPDTTRKKVVVGLNKLIEVNNDRNREYKKAMEEVEDIELKSIFRQYYQQSQSFKNSLAAWIKAYGGVVSHDLYNRKVFQQIWVDLKSMFPANDREAILNACEYMEAIAIDQYKEITSLPYFPSAVTAEIYIQKEHIVKAHHEIITRSSVNALLSDKDVN